MKSAQEILTEIDRLTGSGPDDSYDAALEDIKSFILSGECEHEWVEVFTSFGYIDGCRKCKVKK